TRTGNSTTTKEHHSGSRVCGVEAGDWAIRRVVTIISIIYTVEAEDGALRHVVARLVSLVDHTTCKSGICFNPIIY
ncbi:MAG: hypothetical protein ACKPKO_03945, partial [Candidatus Fonsibacter sp.]